jgi:hypothetical protein
MLCVRAIFVGNNSYTLAQSLRRQNTRIDKNANQFRYLRLPAEPGWPDSGHGPGWKTIQYAIGEMAQGINKEGQ